MKANTNSPFSRARCIQKITLPTQTRNTPLHSSIHPFIHSLENTSLTPPLPPFPPHRYLFRAHPDMPRRCHIVRAHTLAQRAQRRPDFPKSSWSSQQKMRAVPRRSVISARSPMCTQQSTSLLALATDLWPIGGERRDDRLGDEGAAFCVRGARRGGGGLGSFGRAEG